MQLFNRQIAVTVGTTRITGLDVAFRIVRTARPEPNTAEISIWNLNADNRTRLQEQDQPVELEAGYGTELSTLFKGDLRKAQSTRRGPDWVTTLKSGDGEIAFRTARISESFAAGTSITAVVKRLAEALGVKLGDAMKRIQSGSFRLNLTEFTKGTVVSGQVEAELSRLLKSSGLEWSIQDGALQILPFGQPSSEPAILLSASTGLIGSPEAGEKGIIKVTSLLQGGLRPGRKFKLETRHLNGFYRVEKVTHSGDTHGSAWYSEAEGKPL